MTQSERTSALMNFFEFAMRLEAAISKNTIDANTRQVATKLSIGKLDKKAIRASQAIFKAPLVEDRRGRGAWLYTCLLAELRPTRKATGATMLNIYSGSRHNRTVNQSTTCSHLVNSGFAHKGYLVECGAANVI